jgi:hypothetical protein
MTANKPNKGIFFISVEIDNYLKCNWYVNVIKTFSQTKNYALDSILKFFIPINCFMLLNFSTKNRKAIYDFASLL